MTRIVEIKHDNKIYYAIKHTFLGMFPSYLGRTNNYWWREKDHIIRWCLRESYDVAKEDLIKYKSKHILFEEREMNELERIVR